MIQTQAPDQRLSADDLADLMASFQEVTLKLQSSHDQLTGEVKRLKHELSVANEALERSRRLAALGEMAAGISHEIRNPLAAISLDAASLAHETERSQQEQAAGRIIFAVKTLNAIVQDVLAFAGDAPVRPTVLDVDELCERAVIECEAAVPEGEQQPIHVELGPYEVGNIEGDVHLLHRAMVNVIRNAMDAMRESAAPDGGHRLHVRSERDEPGQAVLVVTDTGPGIPAGVVERMFNPFFTTRATGTGLGLAIVHRIADAHGGRVVVVGQRADSVSGAEIRLVLPQRDAAEQTEAA